MGIDRVATTVRHMTTTKLTQEEAVAQVVAVLTRVDGRSLYFCPMPGVHETYLIVNACCDDDGEKEFAEIEDDLQAVYDALRGDHGCLIVSIDGAIRTWAAFTD